MELFGYNITRKVAAKDEDKKVKISPIPYNDDIGGIQVTTNATGAFYGQYIDMDGTSSDSEHDLILKYREASRQPECDAAVNDIVDQAIAHSDKSAPVELIVDELPATVISVPPVIKMLSLDNTALSTVKVIIP